MKWITRERPKIDRIACPRFIKRFIDKEAEIIYVPLDQVKSKAKELNAIPFDVPDVEFTHYIYVPKENVFAKAEELNAIPYDIAGAEYSHEGDFCTFDYIMKRHKINDPAVHQIATIVHGADTDSFELAPHAAGLWAISAGLSHLYKDDHEQLEIGMKIYDALYHWAKYVQHEKHTWNPKI